MLLPPLLPPRLLLLQMVKHSPLRFNIKFNCYDQSSKATSSSDSSVSYASAVMVAQEEGS